MARSGGNVEAALGFVERALASGPRHVGLRLEAAHDLLAIGRLDAAEVAFRGLAAECNRDVRALQGLGHVARLHDDRAAALDWFRAALVAAPANIDARLEVAAELAECGSEVEALALLEQMLAQEPSNAQALMQRGYLSRRLGDRSAALSWFQAAANANPPLLTALTAMAEEERSLGRPQAARQRLEHVLALDPGNMTALLSLSEQSWLAQDLHECLALARRAMTAHPANPNPFCRSAGDDGSAPDG
jgi:tetratricopeptide (TPR) repeat protein